MRSPSLLSLSLLAAIAVALGSVSEAAAAPRKATPAPVFGHSIVVIPVRGPVLVTPPGRHGKPSPLRIARTVPSGSLIDLSKGRADVEIEAAAPHVRTTHTADVSGGLLRLTQPRAGGGVVDLSLPGRVPACDAAQAARLYGPTRVTSGHRRRGYAREARSTGVGHFRLVGKDGSAVNAGSASYVGTEACNGMTVTNDSGKVNTAVKSGGDSGTLDAGKTWISRCSPGAGSPALGPYCTDVLGTNSHGFVAYTTGLFVKTTASTFDLCQTAPGGPQTCQPWTLTTPDSSGVREGFVTCLLPQTGVYSLRWEVDGIPLGPTMQYNSATFAQFAFPCIGAAGTPISTGDFVQPLPNRFKLVNSYTLPGAVWLDYLSPDLKAEGTGAESLTGVVYQDAGGRPGSLVATTEPCVVRGGVTSDCDVMVFTPEVNVPAGTYWFGILARGRSNVAEIQEGHTGVALWNDNPLSAASDPFGPTRALKERMSLEVNYSLEPPPGSSAPASPQGG
jgi:hypothetical protein